MAPQVSLGAGSWKKNDFTMPRSAKFTFANAVEVSISFRI